MKPTLARTPCITLLFVPVVSAFPIGAKSGE
jgi:hypothetical protein